MVLQFSIQNFIRNLLPEEWSDSAIDILSVIGTIIIVSLIFYVVREAVEYILSERFPKKLRIHSSRTSSQRIKTLTNVIRNAVIYVLYFVYFYIILTLLGIPIGTLLAGAGIAGIAIGLGAQQLIKDIINGFFIIFENQFEVGDWIELPDESISGEVVSVGIRTTAVQAASGEVFYIPNSSINIVNNQSRSSRQININMPVLDETDIHLLEKVITDTTKHIEETYDDVIVEEPTLVGFIREADNTFDYRIAFKVINGEQYMLESAFYREYFVAFQDNNLKIPTPYTMKIKTQNESE